MDGGPGRPFALISAVLHVNRGMVIGRTNEMWLGIQGCKLADFDITRPLNYAQHPKKEERWP
jgi:hypothetical protein